MEPHDDTARIYRELAVFYRSNNDFEKFYFLKNKRGNGKGLF